MSSFLKQAYALEQEVVEEITEVDGDELIETVEETEAARQESEALGSEVERAIAVHDELENQNDTLAEIVEEKGEVTPEVAAVVEVARRTAAAGLGLDPEAEGEELVDAAGLESMVADKNMISLEESKDVAINDYTSKAGIGNEQWVMPDGYYNIRDTFELNANFRNIEGDPITLLFQTWIQYYMGCRDLDLNPYPNFIYEREFDYNTKIYRFIMDHSRRYIQKYAATIAYPTSVSFGQQFNVDSSKNFVETNAELPITFKCIGASYNDPILLYEFNEVVGEYCEGLQIQYDKYDYNTQSLVVKDMENWVKLQPSEKLRGTYFAIPLVNYITYELEWWVPRDKYISYIHKEIKQNIVKISKSEIDDYEVGQPPLVGNSGI